MIELTDELKQAFIAAAGWPGEPWRFGSDVADGLAAVLALVERKQDADGYRKATVVSAAIDYYRSSGDTDEHNDLMDAVAALGVTA